MLVEIVQDSFIRSPFVKHFLFHVLYYCTVILPLLQPDYVKIGAQNKGARYQSRTTFILLPFLSFQYLILMLQKIWIHEGRMGIIIKSLSRFFSFVPFLNHLFHLIGNFFMTFILSLGIGIPFNLRCRP